MVCTGHSLDLSPGWDHCAVFFNKTLNSHSDFLYPDVQMGTGKLKYWGNPAIA